MARLQEMALTRGNRGLLIIALLAGLAAAVLVFVALNQDDENSSAGVITTAGARQVVVAQQNIAAGTEITAEMVKVISVPDDLLVSGGLTDTELVVGEVTKVAIASGEQLTEAKFGPLVDGEGLGYVVPRGKRGIGVEVREATAVGGLLLAGDRVDVVAVLPADHPSLLGRFGFFAEDADVPPVAITILQNVEVLSVAQAAQEPQRAADRVGQAEGDPTRDVITAGTLPENVDEQPNAVTVTLAVDPSDGVRLALLQTEDAGTQDKVEIWLLLRRAGDEDAVEFRIIDPAATFPE